ncbi:MAG: radical SAM protein [Bacteroidota bacterium]
MIVNIIYCIDYPQQTDLLTESDRVAGWLLCSHSIKQLSVAGYSAQQASMAYGLSRPDVALHFSDLPNNELCGFNISGSEPILLSRPFLLDVTVELSDGSTRKLSISLHLNCSTIQSFDVDDEEGQSAMMYEATEQKFLATLEKHPWITIRMDITNKCNLRCIMCHYKEKKIYSQPAMMMTAPRLKHLLHDIAPYVSNIMLSCGFEPLVSKHFEDIVSMIHDDYPHMEIALCSNAMLMDSRIRKILIEKNVTHLILSFDGVTRHTIEKIRVGADYDKIVGNIKAMRDLKLKLGRQLPQMFMDFVLMNSNLHEAPAFVRFCAGLGIDTIDFRHMVGNIFFRDHEDMLQHHQEKYNYYRERIIAEGKIYNIKVRLPEAFAVSGTYQPQAGEEADLSDFDSVKADEQTMEISAPKEKLSRPATESDFPFLAQATCLRPFSEIMIIDQQKILPCSWYNDSMGSLDEEHTLYSIFRNEKFSKVRQKKLQSTYDHNCRNCPINLNLLPTKVEE